MKDGYIEKFSTTNYSIGSFDVYQDDSKELLISNNGYMSEKADDILKRMPTSYRASILDKEGNYVGFIGLSDVVASEGCASIRLECGIELEEDDKREILDIFKTWANDSLNINMINEEVYSSNVGTQINVNNILPKANVIIESNILFPGISDDTLEYFSSNYTIPRLQLPFTIKSSDRAIGIIGLSNVIWSNKRANLQLFLDPKFGDDIANQLSSYIIDDYLDYVHRCDIHNVTFSVSGSDKNKLDILEKSSMNYYGYIPYGSMWNGNVESNMMFQHTPNMKKVNGVYIPENITKASQLFDTEKTEMDEVIELDEGYKLVSPKAFEELGINAQEVMDGHIEAMKDRDNFTIPLGEDKYMLQKGNGNYGISKALMNYSYVLLDENNKYAGYINTLRSNAEGKNVEIEIGIDPKLQNNGLGTRVINKYYDELFSVGCASVTSSVFEFNNPSIKLHEKVAELNGVRLESYYINGRLWDMNMYTRVNNQEETNNFHR